MNQKVSLYFIAAFIVCLILPLLLFAFKVRFDTPCDDKQSIRNSSQLKLNLFNELERNIQSNFPFNQLLIEGNALVKTKLFASTSHADQVVKGKKGYYFYTSQGDKILNNYAKTDLLAPTALDSLTAHWQNNYKELQELGIPLVHAIYPNKSTVYHDLVPWQMRMLRQRGIGRTDQIIQAIKKANPNYPLIDTRDVLIKNKDKKIFLKYDSHWTAEGAFLAFKTIMPTAKASHLKKHPSYIPAWKHDLLGLMGICKTKYFPEEDLHYIPIGKILTIKEKEHETYQGAIALQNPSALERKKVLFFGDSFTLDTDFRLYLAWQYDSIILFREKINLEIIKTEKPDLVFIGNVERYF